MNISQEQKLGKISNLVKGFFSNPKAFFLQNLGIRQTIVKNVFWLAAAEGVNKLLKVFLFIYIARVFGSTEYGKFSFALSFVALFSIFSDLNISKIVTREFAGAKEKEADLPSVLSLEIFLSLATMLIIFVGSFFITSDYNIKRIIWILGVYYLINIFSTIFYSVFRARQKMEYQSWSDIFKTVLTIGASFLVILYYPTIKNLSLAYLISACVSFLTIILFFHYKFITLKLSFDRDIIKKYLILSWPLATAGILASVQGNLDSIMMGHLGQLNQTGLYNAAQGVAAGAMIPMGFLSLSFFPALSKAREESLSDFQRIWDYYFVVVIFLAVPILAGGISLAGKIIGSIYGSGFLASAFVFQLLLVGLLIGTVSAPLSQILIVEKQQRVIFWVTFIGTTLSILVNLLLIPRYSLYGASIALLVSNLLSLVLYIYFAVRFIKIKFVSFKIVSFFLLSLLSSLLMYLALVNIKLHLNIIILILIGFIIYLFCLSFLLILGKIIRKSMRSNI